MNNAFQFHLGSDFDTSTTINPLTSIDSANNIYLFVPERDVDTIYKSITYKVNIDYNPPMIQETKTKKFFSFPKHPIATGYCQFDNYIYYMSSTNTINKIDVSDPYSISSDDKWYIGYLSDKDWITITCDKIKKRVFILQNNDLIVISLPSTSTSINEQINHIKLELDYNFDSISMDGHSSIYHNDKLYIIHGTAKSKNIGIIDLKDIEQNKLSWRDSNAGKITNCFEAGLGSLARNDKVYLFCEDYIKIYDTNEDSLEITMDQLNIPRYHSSIQIIDDDDDNSFRIFIFGGRSDIINGSLPFEYTNNNYRNIDTNKIVPNSDDDYDSMDGKSTLSQLSGAHLSVIAGLSLFILCVLVCNTMKRRRGRGPVSRKAHKKLIERIRNGNGREGVVMRLPSMDDQIEDIMVDDINMVSRIKNLETDNYANNSQDEGVCDVMIDVVSE